MAKAGSYVLTWISIINHAQVQYRWDPAACTYPVLHLFAIRNQDSEEPHKVPLQVREPFCVRFTLACVGGLLTCNLAEETILCVADRHRRWCYLAKRYSRQKQIQKSESFCKRIITPSLQTWISTYDVPINVSTDRFP